MATPSFTECDIAQLWGFDMANRYCRVAFAPLNQEYTLTELQVAGTIPHHLDGRMSATMAMLMVPVIAT